jgi:hypothetical protein
MDQLAQNYNPETFVFSSPKKQNELMVCKMKKPILLQFPKMKVLSEEITKSVELEFTSETGYSSKVLAFLERLHSFIIGYVHEHSQKWFGKDIPLENIKQMYKISTTFVLSSKSEIMNSRGEVLEPCEIVKGNVLECISKLSCIVFTKDTFYIYWELCTAKLHKKIERVPKFGFIEDPEDLEEIDNFSENEEEPITFF